VIRVGDFLPRLKIEQLDRSIRITWPASATGFVLQSKSTLSAVWADNTTTVTTEGTDNAVMVNADTAPRFCYGDLSFGRYSEKYFLVQSGQKPCVKLAREWRLM
jgi:hypothetical protein